MDNAKMVHRVNEVARFFASYPRDEALAGIADHIDKFWERRFRQQLFDYVIDDGGALEPLARDALIGPAREHRLAAEGSSRA